MKAKVAVIGAGTMGTGIAQIAAVAGHDVVIIDRDADALARSRQALSASLNERLKRARIPQADANATLERIAWSADLRDAAASGLIIEAVVERLDVKSALFADVAGLVGPETILASNTSSLSIAAIAEELPHPARFVGLHFFNPVPAMKLVEVIPGDLTAPEVVDSMTALMQAWGKHPVSVRDVPGFIVNRVARPFYAEAFLAVDEGIDASLIDVAITGGGGFRMGPLTLADMIGHDINFATASSVFERMRHGTRFRPQPSQSRLVEQGLLGRKTGHGVYDYRSAPSQPLRGSGPAVAAAIMPEAEHFLSLLGQMRHAPNSEMPSVISVDGVAMGRGDGRPLADRRDVDVILDHVHDDRTSPILIATVRDAIGGAAVARLAHGLGKQLVLIPDRPGQIVLRTLAQIANGAADAIQDGIASIRSIDEAMIHGANYPQGPLAWARSYGLANVRRELASIATATGDALYAPSNGFDLL